MWHSGIQKYTIFRHAGHYIHKNLHIVLFLIYDKENAYAVMLNVVMKIVRDMGFDISRLQVEAASELEVYEGLHIGCEELKCELNHCHEDKQLGEPMCTDKPLRGSLEPMQRHSMK